MCGKRVFSLVGKHFLCAVSSGEACQISGIVLVPGTFGIAVRVTNHYTVITTQCLLIAPSVLPFTLKGLTLGKPFVNNMRQGYCSAITVNMSRRRILVGHKIPPLY